MKILDFVQFGGVCVRLLQGSFAGYWSIIVAPGVGPWGLAAFVYGPSTPLGAFASGPGPASGKEFRHDDDGFPDIDRRHRQHRGGDRHPARAGEDGVARVRRCGVRGVDEDLIPEDQAPTEGEEKDE